MLLVCAVLNDLASVHALNWDSVTLPVTAEVREFEGSVVNGEFEVSVVNVVLKGLHVILDH